jgi:two-component system phosphate regulon sensor histidine kinase PhoR
MAADSMRTETPAAAGSSPPALPDRRRIQRRVEVPQGQATALPRADLPATGGTRTTPEQRPPLRLRYLMAGLAALFALLVLLGGMTLPAAIGALAIIGGGLTLERAMRRPEETTALPRPRTELLPRRTEMLLESMPDPAIVIDRRSLVVYANRGALQLLPALRTENPLSFTLRSPDILDAVEEVLAGGGAREVAYIEKVPVERSFDLRIQPLEGADRRDSDAPREAAILVFQDTTPMRRLEHMRMDFIANASHELRTPLASVLGFIETLQGPARNDVVARERFLEIMAQQARRMARLIDDLLSLSRIELNLHVQPDTPVDLVGVVRQIIDALGPMAAERRVRLAALDLPAEPRFVDGDRDELLRVFENLIENGIKYNNAGGSVEVAFALAEGLHGREIAVSVRDNGPGIAPEHLPRLTERFYRVDVAASRDKGGTGLGLAIVKHIVNRHRGRLHVESRLGEGAAFTVSLLLSARQPAK